MNKQQLAEAIAQRAGMSDRAAWKVTSAFIDVIMEELLAGRSITLPRIGTIEPVRHKERKAQNPRNQETVTIPERTMLRMRTSKLMVEKLNGGSDA